jgi:hypothetical protein
MNCFYKVHLGGDMAFGEAFYRCLYLAKTRGKGYAAATAGLRYWAAFEG